MAAPNDIEKFMDYYNIAFRAACNAAVESTKRPIKKRVIIRLASANETPSIIKRVSKPPTSSTPPPPPDDHAFAVELAKDASWQTLVTEYVDEEKRWNDLLDKCTSPENLKKLAEWIESLISKVNDDKRPATKAVATTLVTVLSLWIAHQTFPNVYHDATVPIRAIFTADAKTIPVEIQSSAQSTGIKLIPQSDGDVPIHLQLDSGDKPMRIDLATQGSSEDRLIDSLKAIADQVKASNKSLQLAEVHLNAIAKNPGLSNMATVGQSIDTLSNKVQETSANLRQIDAGIAGLTTSYESKAKDQIDIAKGQSQEFKDQMPILYRALNRATISINLPEGATQAVALQSFDSNTGKLSSISVTISFESVVGSTKAHLSIHTGDSAPSVKEYDLEEGQSQVLDAIGYRITVTALERYWLFKHKIYLSLTPEIGPIQTTPSGAPNVASK